MADYKLNCRGKELLLAGHTVIMGILNVTPDSFSDGGEWASRDAAVRHGLEMVIDGADIIDIGGESTRPGSGPVSAEQQIRRVVPVIEQLAKKTETPISIDTTSSKVAKAALAAGASMINDVSALRFDDDMVKVAADAGCPVILMHMQGTPGNMQAEPSYIDVVQEVKDFLEERLGFALSYGLPREQLVADPGIGFGKTLKHNYLLMQNLESFRELGVALMVGTSRKAFIGKTLGLENPKDRIWGTAATVCRCVDAGVEIVRVHDVKQMSQVARMAEVIRPGR